MTKTRAAGSVLAVKINANYVNIPGVEGIPEFGGESAEYENTAINETAKTFNVDIPDNGTMAIGGSWDSKDATHSHLLASQASATTDDFQVTFNSGAVATFSALVKSFKVSAAKGGDEKFSASLRISGTVNITAAT